MPEGQTSGLNVGVPESGNRMPGGRFQVLSIDGGGIRGLFAAKVLEIWEAKLGHPIIDHFDLLMGTSTGGIIALGLAAGMPAKELVSFYECDGATIFPKYGRVGKWLRERLNWFRPKYREDPLNEALQRRFGSAKLSELKRPVVIPAYNLQSGRPWLFKTPHFEANTVDRHRQVWEVARSTAAAPTYFPAFKTKTSEMFVDGGLLANNPSLVGFLEVLVNFPEHKDAVRMLNLGTEGAECVVGDPKLRNGGILKWARPAIEAMMQAQAFMVEGVMPRILGAENWHRVKPEHGKGFAPLDEFDPDLFLGLGTSTAAREWPVVNQRFFGHKARTNLVTNV